MALLVFIAGVLLALFLILTFVWVFIYTNLDEK